MPSSDLLHDLASYVPHLIIRQIGAKLAQTTAREREASVEFFEGVILFADISGFTPLTERLSAQGPPGIERLKNVLDDYFARLINLVRAYGGDIFKFTGDGLMALWPAGIDDIPMRDLAHQALSCSQAIQAQLHNYQTEEGSLSLKLALSAGEFATIHLGGVFNRWEFFIAGPAVSEVSHAETIARRGEIILGASTWELLADLCEGEEVEAGFYRLRAAARVAVPLTRPAPLLTPEMEPGLRAFIPGAVLNRLSAMQSGFLPEMRNVTIIFLNLPDMKYGVPLETAQEVMCVLQTVLYRYEGSVNTITVDDKGVMVVGVLGLPPFSHEDDPARGVRAALEMRARLQQMGWRSALGITSGKVLVGTVGSPVRQEYNMTGDAVNLAARLMQAAEDDIFCDEITFLSAQDQIDFEELPPIPVKGKSEPVAIFRPSGEKEHALRSPAQQMVGREVERAHLVGKLQAILRGGQGAVIIVEGEAGIGKSTLIQEVRRHAALLKIPVLEGAGDAIEQGTKYFAWRPIFQQIFGLSEAGAVEETGLRKTWQKAILSHFADDPELSRLAPLLGDVLAVHWEENELTGAMEAEVRAHNTRELLLAMLQRTVSRQPHLLIIEDAHWLDSASWALLQAAVQQVSPLWVVLVTRPMREAAPAAFQRLASQAGEDYLKLAPLPAQDAELLVRQRLGVRALPAPVSKLIRELAEGHPFFSEELALSLREAGYIQIVDGECRLAPGVDLEKLPFPRTIEGVITRRIDRLSSEQQLAIKVASVIGRVFAVQILQAVFPVKEQVPLLPEHVHELEHHDLTLLNSPPPNLSYVFKHVITQEVAYNMMLFAQRRDLHRAVAEWYERSFGNNLASFYPLLAYHWARANVVEKAVYYLSRAGEQALRSYANLEAVEFIQQCIRLSQEHAHRLQINAKQMAQWERQLGEAYLRLGNISMSEQHLRRALDLLNQPLPKAKGEFAFGLLWQLGRQWVKNLLPRKPITNPQQREILLETARVNHHMAEIFFFDQETVGMLYTNLSTINDTEPAGLTPELAEAYGSMGVAAGLVTLHKTAQTYLQRGLDVARSLNHLPAIAYSIMAESVYRIGNAEWEKVKALLEASAEMYRQLGDSSRLGSVLIMMADLHYLQGRYLDALPLCQEVHQLGQRIGSLQRQAWGLGSRAEVLLRLGGQANVAEAISLIEETLHLLAENPDLTEETRDHGNLAYAYLQAGEYQRAFEAAEATGKLIAKTTTPALFSVLEGYASPPGVYLRLWELGEGLPTLPPGSKPVAFTREDCLLGAQRALKSLRQYARIFPIGRPRLALWEGCYAWIQGQRKKAFKTWHRGLDVAQQLGLPWDEARIYLEIGRRKAPEDPARADHLRQAGAIFARLQVHAEGLLPPDDLLESDDRLSEVGVRGQ